MSAGKAISNRGSRCDAAGNPEACRRARTWASLSAPMRSAMIMSPDEGGIFDTLLGLVRKGETYFQLLEPAETTGD